MEVKSAVDDDSNASLSLQVGINVAVIIASTPSVTLNMPVLTEPHVELTCGFPIKGLAVSLFYNVMLVLVCTYYAFKTRTVPDNFNESRYITLCVYTTLVIWLAFLPTYFLTSRTYHRIILICAALVLNASVLLLCLFMSKIYALYHGQTSTVTFKYNLRMPREVTSRVSISDFEGGQSQVDSRTNSQANFCKNCQENMTYNGNSVDNNSSSCWVLISLDQSVHQFYYLRIALVSTKITEIKQTVWCSSVHFRLWCSSVHFRLESWRLAGIWWSPRALNVRSHQGADNQGIQTFYF